MLKDHRVFLPYSFQDHKHQRLNGRLAYADRSRYR